MQGFVDRFLRDAKPASPRGEPTLEVTNAWLSLDDPLDRVMSTKARNLHMAFAIGEWVALMAGVKDIAVFQSFIKSYDKFSTDGKTLDGAYGPRIWNALPLAIDLLRKDPYTRQAVLPIYSVKDILNPHRNTPCTISIQLLLRDGKLDAITTMRSNDLYYGLPYDVFSFTMLQEFVARQLGVELGTYYHNVGSLHLYTKDLEKFEALRHRTWPRTMGPMPADFTWDDVNFLKLLMQKHAGPARLFLRALNDDSISPYTQGLGRVMASFWASRTDPQIANKLIKRVEDQTLKHVAYRKIEDAIRPPARS